MARLGEVGRLWRSTQSARNRKTCTSRLKTSRIEFWSNWTSNGTRFWECSHITWPFFGLMRLMDRKDSRPRMASVEKALPPSSSAWTRTSCK